MVPGTSGYSGAAIISTSSRTYARFSTQETSTVESVLKKAKTFGFRKKNVLVGYKKQYILNKTDKSYEYPQGTHFIFQDVSPPYLKQRKVEIINDFFQTTTLELLEESADAKPPLPELLVGHAFAYDTFIRENAGQLQHQEAIPDLLSRLGDTGQKHLCFLQRIANAMQAKPEFDPDQDGQFLLAIWIEFSNAMAFGPPRTADEPRPKPFRWQGMTTHTLPSNQNKRPYPDGSHELPVSIKRTMDGTDLATSSALPGHNSTNQENTPVCDQKPGSPKESSTQEDSGHHKLARNETGSHSGEENFIDKARREGKSEAEIAVLKVNYLSKQVRRNLELLRQEQINTRQPTISEKQKREVIVNLNRILSSAAGLLTKKTVTQG